MDSTSLYELSARIAGLRSAGVMLRYVPPDIQWVSDSSILIPAGRYFQIGARYKGQYDEFTLRGDYWDIAEPFQFTVSSGVLDNGIVNNNWYSVFLVGDTQESVQILPFIRIYTVDYNVTNAGKTTIVPGNQGVGYWDTQVEQTGYINSNGSWNGYRLKVWPNDLRLIHLSPTLVVEDTINSTTDEIILEGDQVTPYSLQAGNCLQLLPPSNIRNLYLGAISFNSSGNIRQFIKSGWTYSWARWTSVGCNLSTPGNAANTFVASVPPNATKVKFSHYIGDDNTNYSYGHYCWFMSGDSETSTDSWIPASVNTHNLWNYYNHYTAYKRSRQTMEFNLTNNQCIRNIFSSWRGSAWYPTEFGDINVYGWSE